MKKRKAQKTVFLVCLVLTFLSVFATQFSFWTYEEDSYETTAREFFSSTHLYTLIPLMVILLISALGIVLCIKARRRISEKDPRLHHFSQVRFRHSAGSLPRQEQAGFMKWRWMIMIVFSLVEIFGGILLGVRVSGLYLPVLSCGANTQQTVETSCYFLANPGVLLKMPLLSILGFAASTVVFTLILGRVICGFLCPMGLIQDIIDQVRTRRGIEGIRVTEKMNRYLVPLKWLMVFLFLGLALVGSSFCNICPAITVSPVLGGIVDI